MGIDSSEMSRAPDIDDALYNEGDATLGTIYKYQKVDNTNDAIAHIHQDRLLKTAYKFAHIPICYNGTHSMRV